MHTALIPLAITILSALRAHASAERDGADYEASTDYILHAAAYASAGIVSVVAWVLWWVI
ncbi:hypothetical protein H0A71_05895 [Alcaligenaceae bacterium]|nr:hypothetical protein [Alcaligenaceae bacterium]